LEGTRKRTENRYRQRLQRILAINNGEKKLLIKLVLQKRKPMNGFWLEKKQGNGPKAYYEKK
jgi:hypothetical protein